MEIKGNLKKNVLIHLLFGFVTILILFFISELKNINTSIDYLDFIIYNKNIISLDNLLATQISVTFLTTSLLSILSIKDKVIYGIDIIQYKLEYPQHSNFASLWSYLIALQICSITFFFIKEATIFIFLFALSLCILTFLMYRILETFFNQDNLTDEISQKIVTDLSKNENPSCLLSLYETYMNVFRQRG